MIIDAGGGTVDISSYSCVSTTPQLVVEEVAPAECEHESYLSAPCRHMRS